MASTKQKLFYLVTPFVLLLLVAHTYRGKHFPQIVDKAACQTKHQHPRTDAVVLLTQCRSGSSFLGELFNQRTDVAYFYEPLYPFPNTDDEIWESRIKVLERIIKCEFKLEELYKEAFNHSKKPDINSKCMKHKICFTALSKMSRFMSRDTNICKFNNQHQTCPQPIDESKLSEHCKKSLLRAMKVNYLPRMDRLVDLLQDAVLNVKVIHLVRDPRAIVKSRIADAPPNRNTELVARQQAKLICERHNQNTKFTDEEPQSTNIRSKIVRIRHEDFAMNPIQSAEYLYDFIGINMTPQMRQWIIDATSPKNNPQLSKSNSQGTKRNSGEVVTAWRKKLTWEQVEEIQNVCEEPMRRLGYKLLNAKEEMNNTNISTF